MMSPLMKASVIAVFIALCSGFAPDAPAQAYKKYLSAAMAAADWLTSLEHTDNASDGLSWPVSDASPMTYTGLDQGAAGIGMITRSHP